ncbi:MAG: general secretion pathway protein GspB [Candidatus Omnitrophica bacterium]|nr:general secretion pathway protein GspB [Candidatus Omnitrophota bacterium]
MLKKILLVLAMGIIIFSSEYCYCAPAKKHISKKTVSSKTGTKKNSAKGAIDDVNKAPAVRKNKNKLRSEIKYSGFDSKRDPFCPPSEVSKMLEKPDQLAGFEPLANVSVPKIDLQGIIFSKKVPQVIINGGVMNVGEFIDEFEIKEIQRTGIILFYKGDNYFIKMLGYERPKNQKNQKKKR